MVEHEAISYVEFPARDIETTKAFFSQVFGWSFQDFGTKYAAFSEQGISGGFFQADLASTTVNGGALVVFYSEDLEATQAKIEQAGGKISTPTFSFPGGRRFQFIEPSGNELAVWSDR